MRINNKEFSEDEVKIIYSSSLSKEEVLRKLGFSYSNGRINKLIKSIASELNISMGHFDSTAANKARRIYPIIKKSCPVCSKEFETLQGFSREKTTCSIACSNTFFSDLRYTEESNVKKSQSLILFYENKIPELEKLNQDRKEKNCDTAAADKPRKVYLKLCEFCKASFSTKKEQQKCCSLSCAAQKRVADGNNNGWSSRDKLKPSFPEKVTMEILEELNLKLEREYKVGKYFIDFADVNRKIALEIDGKQHELPERKIKDEEKDAHLTQQGWRVIRVKWKKLTPQIREELKNSIESHLK